MTDAAGKSFIDLTATIVSAYLSHNPTPASEIPNLISQVHAALLRVSNGRRRSAARARQTGGFREEVDDSRLSGVSRGRQALQVAEAASAHAIQHDAGAIPRQMGPSGRLSDGGAELRGGAFAAGQENGARPAAAAAQVEPAFRRPRRAPRARRRECARPWRAIRWSAAASDAREIRIRRTPRWRRCARICCGV